ncbi:MAG: hypothetical protein AAGL66_04390, partial [Pseudomonadota bacterium]
WDFAAQGNDFKRLTQGLGHSAGRTMRVQVLLDGNPVAGVRLGRGEEGEGEITDGEGVASFIPRPGFNRLWAGRRMSVDAPGYTELSYEYLLTFEALAAE